MSPVYHSTGRTGCGSDRRSGGISLPAAMLPGRSVPGFVRILAVFLIAVLLTGKAAAHPMIQNAMWIVLTPERVEVRMTVSVRELCVVQGLPLAADGSVDPGVAEDTAPRHRDYVLDHLELRGDDRLLTGKVTAIDPPSKILAGSEGTDRSFFTYHLDYPLPAPPPGRFSLRQTMVKEFPSAPGVPWDLSYAYRCGTPSEPMKNYGVLPREISISFLPDASMVPDAAAVGETPGGVPPAQAGLMVLWAAFGFNAASRRDALRMAGVAAGAFILGAAGFAACRYSGPGWVLTGLAGVGILLTSVDNIHRPGVPADKRRLVLAGFFPLAAGYAAAQLAASATAAGAAIAASGGGNGTGLSNAGGLPAEARAVAHLVLPAAVVFLLTSTVMLRLQRVVSPKALRAIRQWLSLLCAVLGLVILFHGLGIRPWDFWLNRLQGKPG